MTDIARNDQERALLAQWRRLSPSARAVGLAYLTAPPEVREEVEQRLGVEPEGEKPPG